MAAVLNLLGLAQLHKSVACASSTVAGSTEGRQETKLHQPFDYFIQRALIRNVKLLGIGRAHILGVTAYGSTRAAADLRNAQMQCLFTHSLVFTRRNNHTCIRNSNADNRNNLAEGSIINTVVKNARVDIIGAFDTRYADGMRTYAMHCLQMLCMHQKTGQLVAITLQTEQYAQAYIINAALHGSVHSLRMISVIMLRSTRMQVLIAFLMIGFLEEDIGTDACFLQLAVIFYGSSRNVYVYAADSAVFMLNGINSLNAVQNIFNRIVYRILASLQRQTLMAHILQCDNLGTHLVLRKLFTSDMLISCMVRTIYAVIDTIVG